MATVTPINSWPVPVSTDLVKDGAVAIESLGDAIDASVGSGLLTWTTYTPTLSGTGWVKGSGTITGRYVQLGKIVMAEIVYVFNTGTGGTAGTGAPTVSLPIAANTTITPNPAQVTVLDTSTGALYMGQGSIGSTGVTGLVGLASGTYTQLTSIAAGVPMVWANGDEIRWNIHYEAA